MDLKIADKLALVTGASRGIGKAIADFLAQEGAEVLLVARSPDKLELARQELSSPRHAHHCFAVDLMAQGGVSELVNFITTKLRPPDIIVHNLGGSFGTSAFAPVEDWKKVWEFNVGIGHELNCAFIPSMRRQKWGRIVCLSTLSTRTHAGYAPYVSAKCALDGYIKAVNREVSKDNVVISAVAPGAVYSEGRYFAKLQADDPAALQDYFKHHLPIQRLGRAEEIAPMVAFLCSEHASFMAGSIVEIDGGGM